jgi:hypothetical protein
MGNLRKHIGIMPTLAGVTLAVAATTPAAAESRGYVVSWFATATTLDVVDYKSNCPDGRSGTRIDQVVREVMAGGYTREEALKIVSSNRDTIVLPDDVLHKVDTRAVVNGHHVSVYNFPEATTDPDMETVSGKYAYGFDLGSKNSASKFTDPQTHKSVDNQWWRAIGCSWTFRSAYPTPPYDEEGAIATMSESQPGWAIEITGDDLSKDGKVTVTVARTTQHLEVDANNEILRNVSYILDPDPSERNVFQGRLEHGVLTITPGSMRLKGPLYGGIALRNAHMRMKSDGDKIAGFWGGYMKWLPMAFAFTSSPNGGSDTVGIYYALKKLADASPDPRTGQNTEISATFRFDAVPAYLLAADGTVLAKPAPPGAQLGMSSAE